jgi:hypothetical protein
MRTPFPCLWFDGKAEEAAEFYTSLLPDGMAPGANRAPRPSMGKVSWFDRLRRWQCDRNWFWKRLEALEGTPVLGALQIGSMRLRLASG